MAEVGTDTSAGTAVSEEEASPPEAGSPEAGTPEAEMHAGALVTWSHGQEVLHPRRESYLETAQALHDEGFGMCVDVTAVDYLERPLRVLPPGIAPQRYEVVANLLAMDPPRRIRLRVQVSEGDPSLASLWHLFPGIEAAEREVFDLFGIVFEGHPDLTRILMPEDWEGHPLRKDYGVGRIPVQFKAAPPTR